MAGDAFLSRFSVEAKKFDLSMREEAFVLQLEERRKGLPHVAFLGLLCTGWLLSMMEELVHFSGSKDFIKSSREGLRVTTAQRGSNSSARFLKVAVYTEGGRRGLLFVLKGREGWGWSCFGAELSTVKAFFDSTTMGSYTEMLGPLIGVPSLMGKKVGSRLGVDIAHLGGEQSFRVGVALLYAEVVSSAISSSNKKLPVVNKFLGQREDFSLPKRGPSSVLMEVRSAMNCYYLEKQTLDH
jgi:hypothetical protein